MDGVLHVKILLKNIIPIKNMDDYKLHLACWNGVNQPLDVFVRDREEWTGWNIHRGRRNDFSRDYIFSLIDFYPEHSVWLFGGVYKVLERLPSEYRIQLMTDTQEYIGRLKIFLPRPGRAKAVYLENYYEKMIVTEVLKSSFTGEAFPGYEGINIGFSQLEMFVNNEKRDWKAALENVKGVYLITDKSNGRKYIGSAYGDTGIWSRWASYAHSGHGHTKELKALVGKMGMEYVRDHFQFTLLEYRSMKTDDKIIIDREGFWKEALLSRGEFGYNKN